MKDIIEYVKETGKSTIEEVPFGEVDSLVLSQFSYLKFDGIVPGISQVKAISVEDIAQHELVEKLFSDERYAKDNRALFQAMVESERFRHMKLNFYVNMVDTAWEMQFSAVTCLFPNGLIYVAYRGTDESLIGWKEDFNMGFLTPVPAQEKAVQYLNRVSEYLAGGFMVGGHSKGGNLAVYSAMKCKPSVSDRIVKIYSHDGPGFREEILQSGEYEKISDRVCKLLPHSSIVGMLLQQQEKYEVVECRSVGLFQHNPYNWIVEDSKFKQVKEIDAGTRILDDGLNKWAASLDKEQLQEIVEALYQVINATEATTLLELTRDWKKSAAAMTTAIKDMDQETKKMIKLVVKALFKQLNETVKEELPTPKKIKLKESV